MKLADLIDQHAPADIPPFTLNDLLDVHEQLSARICRGGGAGVDGDWRSIDVYVMAAGVVSRLVDAWNNGLRAAPSSRDTFRRIANTGMVQVIERLRERQQYASQERASYAGALECCTQIRLRYETEARSRETTVANMQPAPPHRATTAH